jgi:hypothetical protein
MNKKKVLHIKAAMAGGVIWAAKDKKSKSPTISWMSMFLGLPMTVAALPILALVDPVRIKNNKRGVD